MLCYVSQPNGQCLEVQIDPKQTGQVVFDKVMEMLGILEVDYFGLQYKGAKGEDLWLNLRNRISVELQVFHSLYRLSLRVKFFVPFHFLQQEPTKDLFYTQTKETMKKGLISLVEPACDEAKLVKVVACIAQAELGDRIFFPNIPYTELIKEYCPGVEPEPSLVNLIRLEHSRLNGVPRISARNLVLKEVSTLPGYGVEEHRTVNAQGSDVHFLVGPEGITLFDCKTKAERMIPYSQVQLATHNEKAVQIELLDEAGETQSQECFKLISRKAAVALYRCITEMHSFYRCDTVCSDVHSQYCRDFKGTFVSIFYENSDFGKRYIFDIQRTSREAYDHVRRKLYAKSASPLGSPVHSWPQSSSPVINDENGNTEKAVDGNSGDVGSPERNRNLQVEYNQLKQKLETIEESLLCCICLCSRVCIVLCPCGHMTCDACSERIESCPQCRKTIDHLQRVFLSFGSDPAQTCKEEEMV